MIIKSLEHLNRLSIKIAENLSKEDCIFLIGEIGSGKTTFTRNLINYLQILEKSMLTQVLSPTFNLLYEYELKNYKIMHYDLYRLKNIKEVSQLGIFNENIKTVKIIEWPKFIKDKIKNKIELKFSYCKNQNERNLKIERFGKWKNFKIDEI